MVSNALGQIPVVILAGGLGTRLRSVLPTQPKGLAPIGSRSFLEIQIELLRAQGARHFVLCVGYLASNIKERLGDGTDLGVQIEYSVEGEQLLGTAGALKLAERFFAPRALVLNGDTYFDLDYRCFVEHHLESVLRGKVLATLALSPARDSSRFGTVLLDGEDRYVRGFREKEVNHATRICWLNAGAYVMERELLTLVPAGKPCSLEKETFPAILAAGRRVAAFTAQCDFYDIGTPDGLRIFSQHLESLRSAA